MENHTVDYDTWSTIKSYFFFFFYQSEGYDNYPLNIDMVKKKKDSMKERNGFFFFFENWILSIFILKKKKLQIYPK